MKTTSAVADFSSVEWSWSFWLAVLVPAILASAIGLYSGARQRSARARTLLFILPVLCLSLLLYFLWIVHAERISQAKLDYFMKYENPPTFSWSAPPYDEPVYDDWRTPGNKGFYIRLRNKDGDLYVLPPNWVWGTAPVYCATFWIIGYLLMSIRSKQKVGS